MIIMTSASANKMLKQLNEEKAYYIELEQTSSVYTVIPGEEAIIPEYDYKEVANKITEIDNDIQTLKHAINKSNVETYIDVDGETMSVDTALVRMAQLSNRKSVLDTMRRRPLSKVDADRFGGSPMYQYINYDLDIINEEYREVAQQISNIQLALDRHNQLDEFEVDMM